MIEKPPQVDAGAGRVSALASLHVAVLLFGLAGLFGKWIDLPAAMIVFGRTAVAAALLGLLLRLAPPASRAFDWRMAVNGAVLAVHWFAFFKAIQIANVATGLLGFASFPLFVLLLELVLLRARARGADWAIAGLVVVGLLVLVPEPSLDNRVVQGLAWGMLSGFSFAVLAVSNRALAARRAPTAIAFWQNVCAAACLAPALALAPAWPGARELALLLVLGVFCTALAHTLFIRSMRVLSAHTASVIAALEPVYGIGLAVVLLHEVPDARTMVGAVLIVGAVLAASARAGRTPST
ncbi:MAG TPA: DMT family transporter [Casimicrobiaceae bacterium]|nr:DMT family transporter [Casimicrobiaceae bacterium]